ncbi:pirin family protein [Gammaproteobacteria bacterium]|nr:pirin family protein [Gammaproteobacteria bacterium]
MSIQPCNEPNCIEHSDDIELLIKSHEKDLGEFTVRRSLPSARRRMVGPYVFFDHMGPSPFSVGQGVAVRPHPHIGIATVTFLFDGEIMHRDSLGYVQPIRPGAVNFMTAGRGIVHSERTSPELMHSGSRLHGIQLWLALPAEYEEVDPAFVHYPAEDIPVTHDFGPLVTVIMGEAYGIRSPVVTLSPTLYVEALFSEAGQLELPGGYTERAVYVVEGEVFIEGCSLTTGNMAVIRTGALVSIQSNLAARVMIIGGEPFPEKRNIWWNFVSTSPERIEQAKQQWKERCFDQVPGETEFIPLPD